MHSALVIGLLSILALSNQASAEQTVCSVVQICPLKNCPYIDSDNDEYKMAVYTEGCLQFAQQQGLKFIKYVPAKAPHCMVLMTIEGEFDCKTLR